MHYNRYNFAATPTASSRCDRHSVNRTCGFGAIETTPSLLPPIHNLAHLVHSCIPVTQETHATLANQDGAVQSDQRTQAIAPLDLMAVPNWKYRSQKASFHHHGPKIFAARLQGWDVYRKASQDLGLSLFTTKTLPRQMTMDCPFEMSVSDKLPRSCAARSNPDPPNVTVSASFIFSHQSSSKQACMQS